MIRTLSAGAIAGATGELVLEAISYGDMLVRARPASQMPGKAAAKLANLAGIEMAKPGERADKQQNRQEASGALLGYGVAIGTATGYAVLRAAGVRVPWPIGGLALGAAAMALSDSVATAIGVTDPRQWGTAGWLLDVIPHAAFGLTAAATVERLEG